MTEASAKLQEKLNEAIQNRLEGRGSTLFQHNWKKHLTPSLRQFLRLQASGRRTSGRGCTSWPTTRQTDGEKNVRSLEGSLKEIERKGGVQDLCQAAKLAHGTTPSANKNTPQQREDFTPCLAAQAQLASWATPKSTDTKGNPYEPTENRRSELRKQASLTASGPPPNGSPAATASSGQLNPAHSRWLMGLPTVWDACAAMVMLSSRKSRKRS